MKRSQKPLKDCRLGETNKLTYRTPSFLLAEYRLSDNAGGVNHFLSVLLRALRRARHFALVEAVAVALAFALPTKARS
jgi:hypothetical protein